MPEQMLMYRAASWWVRAYAPELAMGMRTEDEIRDTIDLSKDDYEVRVVNDIKENANKEFIDIEEKSEQVAATPEEAQDTVFSAGTDGPGY
jgi:hypothetical protein